MSLSEDERRAKTGVVEAAEAALRMLDHHLAEIRERREHIVAFLAELRAGRPTSDKDARPAHRS